MHLVLALLVCAALSCNWAYASEVYKWIDERGKTHYGDRPPGNSAEEFKIKPQTPGSAPPTQAERRERRQRLLNMFEEERQEARLKAEEEKHRKEQAAKNCAFARDRLRSLEWSSYIYKLDKQGNRIVLPDEQREDAITEAKQAVKRWCT